MRHLESLRLDAEDRALLWQQVFEAIEGYVTGADQTPITPPLDPAVVRAYLANIDFSRRMTPREAVDFAVRGFWQYQMHTAHPRYFGLFNPTPTTMGIAADALVAAFNPQLAAWGHNPFAVEVEQFLLGAFARRFGYPPSDWDGTFASGGAEANYTAILTALVNSFPEFAEHGLRGLEGQPTFYVSAESHHSFVKGARACGLGTNAIRRVPVDDELRLDLGALTDVIVKDRAAGFLPFMLVATAGSTSAGVVDPIREMADIAAREQLWFHVDAAWGGAAIVVEELRPVLDGIELSDSLTFDAHKWLSVPMAAGLYLTRHRKILDETFRITAAYIPTDAAGLNVTDPYTHSMQWSRRFIGLKLFLSLAVAGWDGYAAAVRHQVAIGDILRDELRASNWNVVNTTPLPVVCFTDGHEKADNSLAAIERLAREVNFSGAVWISVTRLKEVMPVLRACITSFRAIPEDIRHLVTELNNARQRLADVA